MKLYLVRHGDALSAQVDSQRPLSAKGVADIHKVAAFLNKGPVEVGRVYHSGLKRAIETANILIKELKLKCPVEKKDCLAPDGDIEATLKEISKTDEDLMIVGHLPHLSYLASKLVTGSLDTEIVDFKKGAVILLEKESSHYFRIKWIIVPKLIL